MTSYYIRDRVDHFLVVDEEERMISKHKTRLSASNNLFKRMIKDKLRKKKKVVDTLKDNKENK